MIASFLLHHIPALHLYLFLGELFTCLSLFNVVLPYFKNTIYGQSFATITAIANTIVCRVHSVFL